MSGRRYYLSISNEPHGLYSLWHGEYSATGLPGDKSQTPLLSGLTLDDLVDMREMIDRVCDREVAERRRRTEEYREMMHESDWHERRGLDPHRDDYRREAAEEKMERIRTWEESPRMEPQ